MLRLVSCRVAIYPKPLSSSRVRDEGCCGVTRTSRGSQVQTGRWGARPGASGRHGPWFGLCRGNHAPAGRRHHHRGVQLRRHAGEREGAGEAAAAAAAELRPDGQPAETEAAQDAFHPGAAQRAGAQLRKNPLSWHLHEGRAGAEDRPHRVQSPGKFLCGVEDFTEREQGVALGPD